MGILMFESGMVSNCLIFNCMYVHSVDLNYKFAESNASDFPRVKLKYIRELGNGRFGKVISVFPLL